jgi:transcriptional regulator GlxA family with amidase domain
MLSDRFKASLKFALAMVITYAIALSMDWEKPVWAGLSVAFCSLATTGESIRQPDMIVRKAEDCFMAAEEVPVSLADLCAAACVSKSTLYLAFQHVCGQPPLEYFHKRRLTRARLGLLESSPQRGAVKRVALDAGAMGFGRFAGKYRRLFGESPSATLSSPPS